jgi:glycosyltransferase involved in cell wall biosynthesis
VIDHALPTPDLDSGSLRMMEILKAIRHRGHHLAFIPEGLSLSTPYAQNLQQLGVEVVHRPYYPSVTAYLEQHGRDFDLVIVSRADVASNYLDAVQALAPQAKAIFDTVDLYFVREARAAEVLNDHHLRRAARRRKRQEIALASQADATLVVSPLEKAILETACPGTEVRLLPNIIAVPSDEPPGYEPRRYIVYLGGFSFAPNVDAVVYFVEEILPQVVEHLPDVVFQVVGSNMPARICDLASKHVDILGYVPEVGPIFDRARVAVAPLRFGAGVKGKVNQSMAHGVPTVVTSIAAEGMHLVHEHNAMIADDPTSFASAVIRLWTSPSLWQRISVNGRQNVREHFSVEATSRRIDELLAFAGLARAAGSQDLVESL